MTPEEKYRRLIRLFPARWRQRYEEELIATLLEDGDRSSGSIDLADAFDLIRAGLAARWQASRSSGVTNAFAGLTAVLVVSVLVWETGQRSNVDVSVDFFVTSLVVILIPGTGVVYTVSNALGGGWRRGLFAAIGCTLGIVPHILAALVGLSGVMQAGAVAFETVRWAGVAYLAYMGISMIRATPTFRIQPDTTADEVEAHSIQAIVRRGIVLNLLNPKLTVFFFAFLPQFLVSPPRPLDPRLVGLGWIFMVMTLVVFLGYAYTAAIVRRRVLTAPRVLRWVRRSLAALLIGFAAKLAITDR